MQELRKQNNKYCLDLANKPENMVPRAGFPNGVWNQPMFEICMKNRGTLTYGAWASMQKKNMMKSEEQKVKESCKCC